MATETQKAIKRERKDRNIKYLIEKGIKFEVFNNSVHLRIGEFDYFPSTYLFISRVTHERGYGVKNLLQQINIKPTTCMWRKKEK